MSEQIMKRFPARLFYTSPATTVSNIWGYAAETTVDDLSPSEEKENYRVLLE